MVKLATTTTAEGMEGQVRQQSIGHNRRLRGYGQETLTKCICQLATYLLQ